MEFLKFSASNSAIVNAIITPVFEDFMPPDTDKLTSGTRILDNSRKSGFAGKKGETFDTYDSKLEKRIVLIGLGKKKGLNDEILRRSYSSAFSLLRSMSKGALQVVLPGLLPNESKEVTLAIALAAYDFDKFRSDKNKTKVEKVFLTTKSSDKLIFEGRVIADAINFTRDIANLPPSIGTPSLFEKTARKIQGVTVKSLDREDFIKMGMGGLEGVSRAAKEAAKLLIMEYGPKSKKPVLIVGKGITFDSGGISIKPADGMDQMKFDKCGASAIIGTMKLISDLGLNRHVIGMTPLTENLPGGNAYKPGDILTHYNGVTSEVLSTDAEGRLVLADALSYGTKNFKPASVIDLATLTGACVVALGNNYAGMMGNNDSLKEKIKKASEKSWERIWELPLDDDFQDQIKSKVADIKNTGGREGGAETAGAFLSRFVGDTPWVHLDIAGTAWTQKNNSQRAYLPLGATGFGVRLLYEFLKGE
ncbi:MAG: leucyl aminopeptidase [Thermoplasmatales archaeon]